MAAPDDFGQWINPLQDAIETYPRLPPPFDTLSDTINSTLDLLISILDIALTFLDVIKTFLIGYTDPIIALLEAIIAEVEGILLDLRNVGFYMNGDMYLLKAPFADLVGGFQAYEQRMITRFIDRSDPTRPDISPATQVFGAFLYVGVEAGQIDKLKRFLVLLAKFFSFDQATTKTTLTPTALRADYGTDSTSFALVLDTVSRLAGGQDAPDTVQISWTLSSPTLRTQVFPLPVPPPEGFLIEVATFRDGLPVYFDRPVAGSPAVRNAAGEAVQDRERGRVLDPENRPLVIYGGADAVQVGEALQYNNAMAGEGEVADGAARAFAIRSESDNVPIPLEQLLTDDGKYLLQRTFYVPTSEIFGPSAFSNFGASFFENARYSSLLKLEDMPYDAEFIIGDDGNISVDPDSIKQPKTFYARVSVVSSAVTSESDFQYILDPLLVNVPGKLFQARYSRVTLEDGFEAVLSKGDKGEPSEPLEFSFPTSQTAEFLQYVTAALAVLILSRSDVEVDTTERAFVEGRASQATGLESFRSLIPVILDAFDPSAFFQIDEEASETSDVGSFRGTVLSRCRRYASILHEKMGANPELEQTLLSRPEVQSLLTYTFPGTGLTILESLESTETDTGLARNPYAANRSMEPGTYRGSVGNQISVTGREPGFFVREENIGGDTIERGSVDESPVLVTEGVNVVMTYVRGLFAADDVQVYEGARQILSIASASNLRPAGDGGWIRVRLGQLFNPLDAFVDTIIEFAQSLLDGTNSVVEILVGYIEFLEARILEFQAVLNRLRAILGSLITINLPSFASLFLLADGSDGILTQFVGADNKPQDSPNFYGGGFVILAAFAPTLLIDILFELLAGD